jgi:hypothetical protein
VEIKRVDRTTKREVTLLKQALKLEDFNSNDAHRILRKMVELLGRDGKFDNFVLWLRSKPDPELGEKLLKGWMFPESRTLRARERTIEHLMRILSGETKTQVSGDEDIAREILDWLAEHSEVLSSQLDIQKSKSSDQQNSLNKMNSASREDEGLRKAGRPKGSVYTKGIKDLFENNPGKIYTRKAVFQALKRRKDPPVLTTVTNQLKQLIVDEYIVDCSEGRKTKQYKLRQ